MKNNNDHSALLLITFLMTFAVSLASIQYVDLDYKQHIGVFAIFLMSFVFSYLCKLFFKNIISFVVSLGVFLTIGINYDDIGDNTDSLTNNLN